MFSEEIGLAFALAYIALLAFCGWLEEHSNFRSNAMNEDEFRKQMNEECGKIPDCIAATPFNGFTLEDHIRHLANWSMPRDSERAQNEMLVAILLLCREWNRTHL